MLAVELVDLLRMLGQLRGEHREDVEVDLRRSQKLYGVHDAVVGALLRGVRTQPVMQVAVAVK